MQISFKKGFNGGWTGSVLAIGLLEDDIEGQLIDIEKELGLSIHKKLKEIDFIAKEGEVQTYELLTGAPEKIIFIGLGQSENLNISIFREAAGKIARASKPKKKKLGVYLPWSIGDQFEIAMAVAEGIRLSLFEDKRFKSNDDKKGSPQELELIGLDESANQILLELEPICSGVELARKLVAAPPNELTPSSLAEEAILIAKNHSLTSKILEKNEIEAKGMGAYLAVAKGSDLSPKFIHLIYRSTTPIKKKIALIGKGLTFDSGGYNLKVGASQIEMMKFDMGGSAVVLGAARAIGEIKPSGIEVHFIIAACENMVNGKAMHPGDIVKASNGKTIEVNNTDAEGRLTLADALVYASELEPDAIVDLATLTGACVIALGDEIAGLWTNNDQLSHQLEKSAKETGEGLWRMPLRKSYKEGLKSHLADMKNTGPRGGGSITAALFLQEFVKGDIPWAHIDIAGTVWSDKDKGINPSGATGYGVKTVTNWICNSLN